MTRSTPYDDDPERYSYASDDDLKRWYRETNTLGKRLSSAEGLTVYFFSWAVGITTLAGLLTLLLHSWIDSWIVVLVGCIILAPSAFMVIVLGLAILSGSHSKKKANQRYLKELRRREVTPNF